MASRLKKFDFDPYKQLTTLILEDHATLSDIWQKVADAAGVGGLGLLLSRLREPSAGSLLNGNYIHDQDDQVRAEGL